MGHLISKFSWQTWGLWSDLSGHSKAWWVSLHNEIRAPSSFHLWPTPHLPDGHILKICHNRRFEVFLYIRFPYILQVESSLAEGPVLTSKGDFPFLPSSPSFFMVELSKVGLPDTAQESPPFEFQRNDEWLFGLCVSQVWHRVYLF